MTKKNLKIRIAQYVKGADFSHKIKSIALFGSHSRGEERNDSDVDLLVEFVKPVSYFELVEIEDQISKKIGKKVDLVTPKALSKFFRSEVIKNAEKVYER